MTSRPSTDEQGDELFTLLQELNFQRSTVVLKAAGLTDEQGARSLVASPTTVTGILKHLALVERAWFRMGFAGDGWAWPYDFKADPDAEFRVTADTSLADVIADYEAACSEANAAITGAVPDELTKTKRDRPPHEYNLRWVLVHMIAETARHNGHLDILREQLDGATGE
jgi:uncharacterized damage-inducible protein DinB